MDGLMDTSFNRDGSFDFNTPLLSSTASSPTYDACDPFTPRSGRSTPHGAPLDFGDSFSSTPAFSAHGSPFPYDGMMNNMGKLALQHTKNDNMDMSIDYSMPLTPTRRMAAPGSYNSIDIDYNTMLQVNLNQHGLPSMSPTHHHSGAGNMVDHFAMHPDLQSSPFGMSTPGRSMPASTPGGNHHHSMWPSNNDSPIMMFGTTYTPSPSPLQAMGQRHQSQSPSPNGSRSSSGSRRSAVQEAQRRTLALQRRQHQQLQQHQHQQQEMMYRAQQQGVPVTMEHGISTDDEDAEALVLNRRVSRSREKCDYPGCAKTYQKREHLKRHQRA